MRANIVGPGEFLADERVYGRMGRAQQSATRNGRQLPHSETEFNGIGGLLTYIGDGPEFVQIGEDDASIVILASPCGDNCRRLLPGDHCQGYGCRVCSCYSD